MDFDSGMLSALSVEELARRAQAGSSEAFGALMGRIGGRLEAYLRRRCGSVERAEDLRQEVMLRAWEKLGQYDPARPFEPWVLTVARNVAANDRRRPGPEASLGDAEVASAAIGAAEGLIAREERAGLWVQVRGILDERQYAALWLRYGRAMSVAEISREMGISQSYVKVTLFRARRRLVRDMGQEERDG